MSETKTRPGSNAVDSEARLENFLKVLKAQPAASLRLQDRILLVTFIFNIILMRSYFLVHWWFIRSSKVFKVKATYLFVNEPVKSLLNQY